MKILPKTRKFAKTIYIKVDDFREEKVEEFISKDILKRFDEYKNADQLREAASLAIVKAVSAYATTYGLPALTEDVQKQIAKSGAKVMKKLNKKLQDQLDKKSKAYVARHSETAIN